VHHKYRISKVGNPYTATIYANLYCDHSTERNIVQSAIYIGAIIGLLGLTPFADSKGKKKMFLIALALCIVGVFRKWLSMQWMWWVSTRVQQFPS
jgi:MFS family permease